jgi:hypothetical protein
VDGGKAEGFRLATTMTSRRYILWKCQYGVPSSLRFANYIPKGASRGAATPIGALLRKDMASVVVLFSRSQVSMAVFRNVASSSRWLSLSREVML